MRLHEAIDSGRPFTRLSWGPTRRWWRRAGPRVTPVDELDCDATSHLNVDDICADDWEVQEPTVTITRAQLADAILAYVAAESDARSFFVSVGGPCPDPVQFIADRLGLSEN